MDIHAIGRQIRQERLAYGLSQTTLASFSGLTRVTIGNLEAGKLRDLGFQKVLRVCELLGLNLATSSPAPTHDWLKIAAQTASTSYRTILSAADLETILVTGVVPTQHAPHMLTLLEEAPQVVVLGAARMAATRCGTDDGAALKSIMKHISAMAKRWQVARFA
jgi:transcriptional regulator with XRE-family HTH domain